MCTTILAPLVCLAMVPINQLVQKVTHMKLAQPASKCGLAHRRLRTLIWQKLANLLRPWCAKYYLKTETEELPSLTSIINIWWVPLVQLRSESLYAPRSKLTGSTTKLHYYWHKDSLINQLPSSCSGNSGKSMLLIFNRYRTVINISRSLTSQPLNSTPFSCLQTYQLQPHF